MTTADGTALDVVYARERDVAGWQARHAQGLVPGCWPYGLDGLAGPRRDVRAIGAAPSTRWGRLGREVRRVVPTVGRGRRVMAVWDENTAGRVLPAPAGVEAYAGVIWLTDRATTSAVSARQVAQLRRLRGVWCLSAAQVEPLRALLGDGGPPVHLVRFGVDTDFFVPVPPPPPEDPLVVSVGGDRDRDAATLFEALEILHRAVPEARIVVQSRANLTPPPGVTKVERLDHRELRALYARMSVMVIATRPNLHVSGMTVGLESMATGRPVVITGTPGMEDYVRDGETGAVVPVGAPERLAQATVALLRDPGTAARWGRRGRDLVEREMTTTHLCDRLAEVMALPVADLPAPVE